MKRIIVAISAGAVVCAAAWIGGFDFNERGQVAVFVFLASVAASVYGYLLAGFLWGWE